MARTAVSSGSGVSATFDADFKETFDNGIQKQYPNWLPLVSWFKDSGMIKKRKLGGKYWTFYAEMHAGGNGGARGENATIASTDNPSGVQGSIDYMRGFKGQFQITAEAMEYGKGAANVFADMMKQSARACKWTMTRLAGPAFWSDGSGILAQVNGVGSKGGSVNVTLLSTEDYNTCRPGSRWLFEGQRLTALTSASSRTATASATGCTLASTTRISKILSDTSIVLSASSSIATNGILANIGDVTAGSAIAGSYHGPEGLLALIDYNFYTKASNIEGSTYHQWRGVSNHNSGTARPQTTGLFYDTYFKVGRNLGSVDYQPVAWTCPDVYKDLLRLMEPNVIYKPTELKMGFKPLSLMINGVNVEIRLDYMCPKYWFFLSPKTLMFINSRPMGLVPDNKGNVLENVANKTNFNLKYWWGCNLGILKRNANAVISDLDVDTIQL